MLTQLENCFQVLTCIWKPLYNLGHSRSLLTNGNINTVQFLLLIFTIIEPFLVDNCVNGKSSFTTRQKWENLITSKLNTPKDSIWREDKFLGKSAKMVVRVCGIMKLETVLGGWGILYEKINFTLQKHTSITKLLVRKTSREQSKMYTFLDSYQLHIPFLNPWGNRCKQRKIPSCQSINPIHLGCSQSRLSVTSHF